MEFYLIDVVYTDGKEEEMIISANSWKYVKKALEADDSVEHYNIWNENSFDLEEWL